MTLADTILKKAESETSLNRRYVSPPPELEEALGLQKMKATRRWRKFSHVSSRVDTAPPRFDPRRLGMHLPEWKRRTIELYRENINLVTAIKKAHFNRGRVDSRWKEYPRRHTVLYYRQRVAGYRRIENDNKQIYHRIMTTPSRLPTTAELRRDWARNRQCIIHRAEAKFVLFPPVPQELIEDAAFRPQEGVKRPRVYLSLRIKDCAMIGEVAVELFTDVCPVTCRLFLELLDGDGLGHGYVGTCFFRKVPGLYWSGGDVIYDNGFGCYAQRGRRVPIGAENYHYSHSMPGLLSMRVTRDDEVCGIFNITFKPLPQFDLHSVVFGRIIRPCHTYDAIVGLGSALSAYPKVLLCGSRRRVQKHTWVHGTLNTKLARNLQWVRD